MLKICLLFSVFNRYTELNLLKGKRMNLTIKSKRLSALGALLLSSSLYAETTTLTLHHFLSSKSPAHTKFFVPWAKKLKKNQMEN